MTYSGQERRTQDHRDPVIICTQEDKINEMHTDVVEIKGDVKKLDLRINGSLEKISDHITEGRSWRQLIVGIAVSLVLTILGGIYTAFTISYNLGNYTKQIAVNTNRLDVIEEEHREWVKDGKFR